MSSSLVGNNDLKVSVKEGRILRFTQANFPTSDKGPGASVTDVSNVSKQVSCRFGEAAAIVMGVEGDHLRFSEKRGKATPDGGRPEAGVEPVGRK